MKNAEISNKPAQTYLEVDSNGKPVMHLTKREHFAAMAMQGIISNQSFLVNMKENLGGDLDAMVSTASIEMADALLAALNQGE